MWTATIYLWINGDWVTVPAKVVKIAVQYNQGISRTITACCGRVHTPKVLRMFADAVGPMGESMPIRLIDPHEEQVVIDEPTIMLTLDSQNGSLTVRVQG